MIPGLDKQFQFLLKNLIAKVDNVLVIGSSSEKFAKLIAKNFSCSVELIMEDYESLLNSKLVLNDDSKVRVSMMDYDITDFDDASFDLIYAQASITLSKRNKIVKEIKRILRPGGFFCVGEIVSLKKNIPVFVQNVFDSSNLFPLFVDELEKYYTDRDLKIVAQQNLSDTLKEYYRQSASLLKNVRGNLTTGEKSYYKKILNKVSHESNVFLKLGGDKFIGFVSLLVQKGED